MYTIIIVCFNLKDLQIQIYRSCVDMKTLNTII